MPRKQKQNDPNIQLWANRDWEREEDLIGFRETGRVRAAAAVAASAASSMKQWLVSINCCECYISVERLGFCFNLNWLQLNNGPFRVGFKHLRIWAGFWAYPSLTDIKYKCHVNYMQQKKKNICQRVILFWWKECVILWIIMYTLSRENLQE